MATGKGKKYLIVGGVAGGATTAARLRRVDEHAEIIMFEKGPHISYANCGLPYYIGGVITEREKLLVQTPESFGRRFSIDVRIFSEVIAIDTKAKTVSVENSFSGESYTETYDKLVLSPGASPMRPPIPGIDSEGIYTLRNVQDTDRIKEFVDSTKPKTAIVVGAGFIGLEMAENLQERGVKVSVVEAAPQVMNMMDPEMAAQIHNHFKEQEVGLYLNDGVKSFEKTDDGITVTLSSGRVLNADIILLSIGVRPDSALAKTSGIEIGVTGGIKVNEYFETSANDVYAVGDSMEFPHPITGKPALAYLAGPANKQGRFLADNIVFNNIRPYKGSIGTAIAKIFDLAVGMTGMTEKALVREGMPFQSTIVNAGSHAGYYPGAMPMTLKITFDPKDGRLYGGQIVGYKGVDKRVDMIAAVVRNNGTIYDLQELEHAYAPPFSSAKDPVNQAGFNAENIMRGFFKPASPYDLKNRDQQSSIVLDVRTPAEFALGQLEGAINIEVDTLRDRLNELPKDKAIYVYCAVGMRGYIATRILTQNGFDKIYNVSGGIKVAKTALAEQENPIAHKTKQEPEQATTCTAIYDSMKHIDASGQQCPGPIMTLKNEVEKLNEGAMLCIEATDAGFYADVESWCNVTGNTLVERKRENGKIVATVKRGGVPKEGFSIHGSGDNKTIVVFSDDMDKALASFVIANGALAMGKKVTMFFTFWGLNVIKSGKPSKEPKDFMGKMFGMMMPKHAGKLQLSNMNMGGMGAIMMKLRMKDKKVDALELMMQKAIDAGANLIGCQMSMDIMGVSEDQFIDGVKIGGVANYLEEAEHANVNLFI